MATINFDICHEYPAERISSRPAIATPEGSAVIRAREVVERELRSYVIRWDGVPRQILRRIRALWAQTSGPILPMNFTPPNESAIEVVFADDALRYEAISATTVSAELTLEEVR